MYESHSSLPVTSVCFYLNQQEELQEKKNLFFQ